MLQIKDKSSCCGCGACSQVCPKECIQMAADSEGFLYPHINTDLCIDCGLCEKSCPILNIDKDIVIDQNAFISYHQDDAVRNESSSGGVFSALAEYIIQNDGVVFGAAFDNDHLVKHMGIETLDGLSRLRGSKYLQSRTESCYIEAKDVLDQGRYVLYSGTGCQIAGLKGFLKKDYSRLYTVDVLCHGVPSPKLWKLYLSEQERVFGGSVQRISFRDKDPGWKLYSVDFLFSNNKEYKKVFKEDPYMQLFLKNICLRPSCHSCKFKPIKSVADITIGDCWGVENYMPEIDDDRGLSLVVVHTQKGEEIFDSIKFQLVIKEADLHRVKQSMYDESAKPHPHRERFFKELNKGAGIVRLSGLLNLSIAEKVIRKLKRAISH